MKTRTLSFLATLVVGTGMLAWNGSLQAQNTPATPPSAQDQQMPSPQQPAQPSSQQPSTQQPQTSGQQPADQASPDPKSQTSAGQGSATGVQQFVGTVTKQGDKYVLKDDSGKTYDIDSQDQVKKFDGKRVTVKGTLDSTGTKIMVK